MEENKFNFNEDEAHDLSDQETKVEETKEAVVKDAKGLLNSSKIFLKEIFSFGEEVDRESTIQAIKNDVPFKGATAWILICSIFVASIGLNANSTAVVIGAMLISPLMGPILGVGMSIAINDIDTLRKSLTNLAVMIVLSLLTAFLFFWLFPLSEDTSELMGRTRPDIRDVLIAFFGGLALIIARAKKGTIASVIFGVAIATALMPPLCTAGYGLAKANWSYFGGAMYLFTINTIFIALATFLVLKILRFPMLRYANSAKRRRISRIALFTALAVMILPIYTFIKVYKENQIQSDYNKFIKEISENKDLWQQRDPDIDVEEKRITLFFLGEISPAIETHLRNEMNSYKYIKDFDLEINGNKSVSADRLMDLYDNALIAISEKDSIIEVRQMEIDSLKQKFTEKSNLMNVESFSLLSKDAKIKFTNLEAFAFGKMLMSSDFKTIDTIAVANVKWNAALNENLKKSKNEALKAWLKDELKLKEVIVKEGY